MENFSFFAHIEGMEHAQVSERMRQLREAIEGADKGSALRFSRRMDITDTRWNNVERGHPLSRDLAILLVQKIPGLSLDWIYFGKTDALTVSLAEKLGELDAPGLKTQHR